MPPNPPRFVDREEELRTLRGIVERRRPSLLLLYGRRRVGKTYLLDHAWDGRRVFYYLAADSPARLNQQELLRDLSAWLQLPFDQQDFPTWRTIFRLFVQLARTAPLIVVLDEFQYLLGQEDDIASQLAAVWDREVGDAPLTIALSGSEITTMERLQQGSQPLYGRPDWSARLRPFDYWNTARMAPERSPREAALVYGIFGGTPRYLASSHADEPFDDFVTHSFLSPQGDVHLQVEHIIEQEKGIRDPADYRAVLTAIASGKTELNDITLAAGLGSTSHVARRALKVLEDLELVWRERNYGAADKAPYRYRIADNAVRFWYAFIHHNRGRLETGDPAAVWTHHVQPLLNDYMGKVFEQIAREGFRRWHARWGYTDAAQWSRWEGQDRNRRSIEIDIVAFLDDGRLLTGEIKWASQAVDYDVHRALLRDLDDLSRSGQGWARDALSPDHSAGFLYLSAGGFTDEFQQRAQQAGNMQLITLADLYADLGHPPLKGRATITKHP
ncbi:MAG TPA: hypothetical protein DEV93_02395 [Chloroflexi bacterium]|jgi:AAA+ ATPase superfamily predicted ATPase|nr:hypothetical protein [Chloroflexota bacterium]